MAKDKNLTSFVAVPATYKGIGNLSCLSVVPELNENRTKLTLTVHNAEIPESATHNAIKAGKVSQSWESPFAPYTQGTVDSYIQGYGESVYSTIMLKAKKQATE